ncbi:hypothetical protein FALBO_6024 [Fusarium albosuccineum]|uniref:Uncharacterized protein n=1 Tax=Fusarium albosuccineum TaxID=1237068 RepID=A0A8H4LFD0_9HYPO|nr:hypothetical protein FALBO_6024 [Fusarium albosuccineum]
MNWTEGLLARHSRRKGWDKDAARQKQYFAKARARKQQAASRNNQPPPTFIPDYTLGKENAEDPSSTPRRKQKTSGEGLIPRRDGTNTSSATGPKPSAAEIAAQRLKLLEKSDWIGISAQKSMLPDFTWHRDHPPKPASGGDHRLPRKGPHIRSTPQRSGATHRLNEGLLSNDDIRIRIGSQDLRWNQENNSVRTAVSRPGLHSNSGTCDSRGPSSKSQRALQIQSSVYLPSEPSTPIVRSSLSTASPCSSERCEGDRQRQPLNEPSIVVRSSPNVIHQPRPTRKRQLSMLNNCSVASQDNESTAATVGTVKRSSHRVTKDDIRWSQWLNSNPKVDVRKPLDADHDRCSRSITPGVSHHWNDSDDQSQTEPPNPSEKPTQSRKGPGDESTWLVSNTDSSSAVSPHSSNHEIANVGLSLPGLRQQRHPSRDNERKESSAFTESLSHHSREDSIKPGSDIILPAGTELPKDLDFQDLMDLLVESEGGQGAYNEHEEARREPTPTEEDEDEIWKKFVFDDDVDIRRKALEEAHEQTKFDLGLKDDPRSDVAEPPSGSKSDLSLQLPDSPPASRSRPSPNLNSTSAMTEVSTERLCSADIRTVSEAEAQTHDSDMTDSMAARPASPRPAIDFKFHQPNLFVGRLASNGSANAPSVPSRVAPKKGRRPRRRDQGRPDFRSMPDHDGDPIEECYEQ